ncbi:MAG: hypothetical protein ACI9P7_001912, partial [Candidatus Azotimanducaceae bacterium]
MHGRADLVFKLSNHDFIVEDVFFALRYYRICNSVHVSVSRTFYHSISGLLMTTGAAGSFLSDSFAMPKLMMLLL